MWLVPEKQTWKVSDTLASLGSLDSPRSIPWVPWGLATGTLGTMSTEASTSHHSFQFLLRLI